MVADVLAKELNLKFHTNKKYNVVFAKTELMELIKPQTFMNNSGVAVRMIAKKHRIPSQHILIVIDDLDMEPGKLRYRSEGSSGGHQGLQSIIDQLGTLEIPRLKIGIGRSENIEPDKYVLGKFTVDQLKYIKTAIPEAVALIKNQFLV